MSGELDGIVSGGWSFIWASYAIAGVVIFALVLAAFLRLRDTKARLDQLEAEEKNDGLD